MVPFLMHKRTFRAGSAILGVVYQALAYVSQLVCLAGFARKRIDAYSSRHSSELYGHYWLRFASASGGGPPPTLPLARIVSMKSRTEYSTNRIG